MSNARHSAQNLLTNLLMYPLAFLGSIVISRLLGAEGRGVYVYIVLICNFFLPYICMGFNAGILYNIGTGKYGLRETYFAIIISALGFAVPYVSLVFIANKFGLLGVSSPYITPLILGLIIMIIPINMIYNFLSKAILAESLFSLDNIIRITTKVVTPLSIIIMILIFKNDIQAAIFAIFLTALLIQIILHTYIITLSSPSFNRL